MNLIKDKVLDEERALYGVTDTAVENCRFDGPADGESAFKECKNIKVSSCYFNLRYPFWHDTGLAIHSSEMTELCRAALWYTTDVTVSDSRLHGIKALRECARVSIANSDINSTEFGWFSNDVTVTDSTVGGEYLFLRSANLRLFGVKQKGKYSFQYVDGALIENCYLDTKDAFWHSKNVTVRNSTVKGEYLAWYSENLTLENCIIIGTQPLCYAKGLNIINCEMRDCDLSFEKSEVNATLTHPIDSIKNPTSGTITVPAVGEIIRDDPTSSAEIIVAS